MEEQSAYAEQIAHEQHHVDQMYERLDQMRAENRERLDEVRAAGAHGSPTQRTERNSFAAMYEDRLMQLRAVEDRLVFGRLSESNGEHRYIGRIGLSNSNHDPILTDWRADAARPFYEATALQHGDITMRRHITLQMRKVSAIEDEVLDMQDPSIEHAQDCGILTGEGALLASLSSRRTSKMNDIVATIQAEQDRIIRANANRALVVQGGPGTGKTAVALHRAAYLLYTHRKHLSRSGVLVVGPSTNFLHYIDQVLPSLGETGVLTRTMGTLIPNVKAEGYDTTRARQLKGDIRMSQVIKRAVQARERVLDQMMKHVVVNLIAVPIYPEDIQRAITHARRAHQPHNQARNIFVQEVIDTILERFITLQSEQSTERLSANELQDLRHAAKNQLLHDIQLTKMLNLSWLPMKATWLIDQLLSKPHQLQRFAPWMSPEDVQTLMRPSGSPLTHDDIALLDEALQLLGDDPTSIHDHDQVSRERAEQAAFAQQVLEEFGYDQQFISSETLLSDLEESDYTALNEHAAKDRTWTFGHIVVDEAQELSPMQWRMLLRRCPARSFTIVGDVAQTSNTAGAQRWHSMLDPILGEHGWDLYELTVNYRNPKQVNDIAAQLAQEQGLYISTNRAVRSIPQAVQRKQYATIQQAVDFLLDAVYRAHQNFINADGTGRVAVITPQSIRERVERYVLTGLQEQCSAQEYQRLQQQTHWDQQIGVISAQDSKGLEYDAVILINPEQIRAESGHELTGAADLYVAMTRPTQQLIIIEPQEE